MYMDICVYMDMYGYICVSMGIYVDMCVYIDIHGYRVVYMDIVCIYGYRFVYMYMDIMIYICVFGCI